MVRALSLPEQRLMLAVLAILVGGLGLSEWRRASGAASTGGPAIAAPGVPVAPAQLLHEPSAAPSLGGARQGLIDLNTADASLLEALPGVGPSKAAAIVGDRTANGPFATVGDLDRVAGFGEKTIARLAPYLTVGATIAPTPTPLPTTQPVVVPTPAMGPATLVEGIALGPRGRAPVPASTPSSSTNAAPIPARLNINTATAAQLEALDGIGPVLAQRIVADRAARGPFRSVDDLDRVKGIGPSIMSRNRHRLAVQ